MREFNSKNALHDMNRYEYKHVVSFEDTNLVGNVYFANYVKWQGRCREFFLKDKSPGVLALVEREGLALITINCSCNYLSELKVFDEVTIKMGLQELTYNRVKMTFDYYKVGRRKELLVATGLHEIGCYKRINNELIPVEVPEDLTNALKEYQ